MECLLGIFLTFGQKPTEFISRPNQIGKIIHTFDMENPSNKVYMVAGAVSELTRISQFHDLDLGLNLNLRIAELSVNKTNDSLEKEAMLRNIFLEPLSIPAITTSYRSVFDISPSKAVEMAKLTKGYPFAFQILGYLKWETNDDLEKLLPKFDEELIVYAYEKIWSELSELDRKIVYVISTGVYKTSEIREKLSIFPQLLNTYRKRLMECGVVNGSVRGELTLALPRFEEYIEMYCEVNL